MRRFFSTIAAVGIGGALAYGIVVGLGALLPLTVTSGASLQIEYTDLISIILTGVSIILAALGFVIALLAFIGWNSIGDRVSSIATKLFNASLSDDGELRSIVRKSLQDGGELHSLVQAEAKEIIYRAIEPISSEKNDEADVED